MAAEDNDWVLDSVLGFMNSPEWLMHVATFTDENCVIFDNEDENKLSYTQGRKDEHGSTLPDSNENTLSVSLLLRFSLGSRKASGHAGYVACVLIIVGMRELPRYSTGDVYHAFKEMVESLLDMFLEVCDDFGVCKGLHALCEGLKSGVCALEVASNYLCKCTIHQKSQQAPNTH
eukprot:1835018-Pleurochrysis_carterae.AAC.1